jgi:hypothetical protein
VCILKATATVHASFCADRIRLEVPNEYHNAQAPLSLQTNMRTTLFMTRQRHRASSDTPGRWYRSFLIVLMPLTLAACASDAWHSDDPFDAFLDQVRIKCRDARLGDVTIPELMPDAMTTNDYFMDVTSRFYHGQIPRSSYVEALQATYLAGPDAPGIQCILKQMPQKPLLVIPKVSEGKALRSNIAGEFDRINMI